MNIVRIMKSASSLKEEINIKVFSHIFERYPPETDFDTVLDICATDENTSFGDQGYIVREQFSNYGDGEIRDLIDQMLADYEDIIEMAFGLYNTLNKESLKCKI